MTSIHTPPFLTAAWRHLALLNYIVDPALLAPPVPRGTELDLYRDQAYVSLVAFRFLNTRIRGIPIPFHRNFDEINLRFYVRRYDGAIWRRGTVFIREFVPRRAIAAIARWCYNENYSAVPTQHELHVPPEHMQPRVRYAWQLEGRWNTLALTTRDAPFIPPDDSIEAFIAEHYWGYTRQRDGSTLEYEVAHPKWRIWNAAEVLADIDARLLYGDAFADAFKHPPASAFLAEGSAVTVHKGQRIAT